MDFKKLISRETLRAVFGWERVICRIIAAWCVFAAVNAFDDGKFYELSYAQDVSLATVATWVLALFAVFSVLNILIVSFETDTWFLFGAATVCVIRWLVGYRNTTNQFLVMLAVTIAYALFTLYFVERNRSFFAKCQPGNRAVMTIAIVLGLIGGAVVALVTCLRYMTFASPNFDFGLFCNMFYNMSETGLPLVTSERDVLLSHFVVHVSPIYYLMLPFYFVFPSPITLQVLQAAVVASGVIPTVLLCKHFKLSGKVTVAVAFLYAFYPALSSGCFYDLHENCFLTPLLLWLFYFFEKEKYPLMYVFAALVLCVKEDAAIYVILFALYVIISRKKFVHGGILAVASMAYFGLAYFWLTESSAYYAELYSASTPSPAIAGPMVNRFDNLIFNAEDGLVGAIKTALVNPGYLLTQLFTTTAGGWEKLVYVFRMLLPLGILPLCTKKASRWLLVAPILMNLLTMYKYQYDTGFHYQFGIIAFLVYAAIQNLPELAYPTRKTLLSIAAVACCCVYMVSVVPTVTTYVNRWKNGREKYTEMMEILDTIPEDASVAANTFLIAHIADRDEIYELKYHGVSTDVDYVIYDMSREYDVAQMNKYLARGYKIEEYHEGKLAILKKAE